MWLVRIRRKLSHARRLSLDWIRSGGDPQDIVDELGRCHRLVEQGRLRAGARVLDGLLARLHRQSSTSLPSDRADRASAA